MKRVTRFTLNFNTGANFCYLFYSQSSHLGSRLFLYNLKDGLNTFNNMKQACLVANSVTGYREWIKSDQSHHYKKYINVPSRPLKGSIY